MRKSNRGRGPRARFFLLVRRGVARFRWEGPARAARGRGGKGLSGGGMVHRAGACGNFFPKNSVCRAVVFQLRRIERHRNGDVEAVREIARVGRLSETITGVKTVG